MPTNIRLAIGPSNSAGQAFQWAEAVRRNLGVPAISFSNRPSPSRHRGGSGFRFPVHQTLPHHRMTSSRGKRKRLEILLRDVTHIAIEGFLSVFERQDISHIGEEIVRLREMGLEVALIAHGSDVRDPDAHMERFPFSYFRGASAEWVEGVRVRSIINRQTAANVGAPLFVSTPDLLLDLPTASWLPVAVDLESWQDLMPRSGREVPTVLHLPSRRDPPIKGTAVIDPVLRQLHDVGRIKYLSPERVQHGVMRLLVQESDIVVDQIQSGSYGVMAVEGMAAGRLVVGNIADVVRAQMIEPPPIVNAAPADFADVMESIVLDPQQYEERASMGATFARRWHGGSSSAMTLEGFLR